MTRYRDKKTEMLVEWMLVEVHPKRDVYPYWLLVNTNQYVATWTLEVR